VNVVVVPGEEFAGRLRDAIEVARAGEFGTVEPIGVVRAVDGGHAFVGLVAADRVVRGGEDELLDLCIRRGVEHGLRAVDIVDEHAVPGGIRPGIAGEVDHRIDTCHRVPERLGVGDVGDDELVGVLPLGRVAVEQSPRVGVSEAVEDRLGDPPRGPREQHRLVHSSTNERTASK
jgi:hypothetical protein